MLVDALEDALDADDVALADRLVAHACRACTRPGSYLRRTRVEREVTINTDRDDRLSVDRRGKGSHTAAASPSGTLISIASEPLAHKASIKPNDLQRLAEARLVGEDPTAALVGAKDPPHALLLMRL